jgi:hypothetical protein
VTSDRADVARVRLAPAREFGGDRTEDAQGWYWYMWLFGGQPYARYADDGEGNDAQLVQHSFWLEYRVCTAGPSPLHDPASIRRESSRQNEVKRELYSTRARNREVKRLLPKRLITEFGILIHDILAAT